MLAYYLTQKSNIASKWPPSPLNDRQSVTLGSNLMILMSIPRFFGARNTLRPLKMIVNHYLTSKSNMASNMATGTSIFPTFQVFIFGDLCDGRHFKQSKNGHMSAKSKRSTQNLARRCTLALWTVHQLKISTFKNPRWRTLPSWTSSSAVADKPARRAASRLTAKF